MEVLVRNNPMLISFSREETISRVDLSDFPLCIVGYSRFWLKVADEESKCIPHEFPSFRAKNATVWCLSDYCLRQCADMNIAFGTPRPIP